MKNFIENLFFSNRKKVPVAILKNHTDILFLTKQLDAIAEKATNDREAIEKKFHEEKDKIWEQISKLAVEKGFIDNVKDDLNFDDGVLFKYEEKTEDE